MCLVQATRKTAGYAPPAVVSIFLGTPLDRSVEQGRWDRGATVLADALWRRFLWSTMRGAN